MIKKSMWDQLRKTTIRDSWNINIIIIVEILVMSKAIKKTDVWIEPIEIVDEENRYTSEMYWIQTLDNVVNTNNGITCDRATYNLDYQHKNKIRLCERIKCSCGKFISRKNISTHKKSVSHFTRFDQLKNKTRKG